MTSYILRCAESQAVSKETKVADLTNASSSSTTSSHPSSGGAAPPPSMMGPGGDYKDLTQLFKDNPGAFEELHKKCTDVFPICFDGVKAMLQKGLSSRFQVSHTINLNPMQSGYRLGATYVGMKQITPTDSFPVLLGDMDMDGNTSATIMHHLGDRVRVKVQTQLQKGQWGMLQAHSEYRGRLWTLGATLVQPDLVDESGVVAVSLLRRLTPRLDVGLEMMYQQNRKIPGGSVSCLTYAARYAGEQFTAAASVGGFGLAHLSYFHQRPGSNLQMGIEWESQFRMQESVATFGYQIDLPEANAQFRSSISSNWDVKAVVEKKLTPLPFTVALSGTLNQVKNTSRFGIGLIIGS